MRRQQAMEHLPAQSGSASPAAASSSASLKRKFSPSPVSQSSFDRYASSTLDLKSQIKDLRLLLTTTKHSLESQLIQSTSHVKTLESQLMESEAKIQRLEMDRRFLVDRESGLTEKLGAVQTELMELKQSTDKTIRDLTNRSIRLQDQLVTTHHTSQDLESKLNATQSQSQATISSLQSQLKQAQEQIERQNREISGYKKSITDLESQVSVAQTVSTTTVPSTDDTETVRILNKHITEQDSQIKRLQHKITKLTDTITYQDSMHQSIDTLTHQNQSLRHQLTLFDETRSQLTTLQSRIHQLEHEKQEWTKHLTDMGHDTQTTPATITNLVKTQHLEIMTLRQQVHDMTCNTPAHRIQTLEHENQGLVSRNRDLVSRIDDMQRVMTTMTHTRNMLIQETNLLKSQIRSYDLEDTNMRTSVPHDDIRTKRMEDLERVLGEYKERIGVLENEMVVMVKSGARASVNSVPSMADEAYQQAITAANQEIEHLKTVNKQLTTQINDLESKLDTVSQSIGYGDYDPTTTRVLMLADNPETRAMRERRTMTDLLVTENKSLREQLSRLSQTPLSSSNSVTTPVTLPTPSPISSSSTTTAALSDRIKHLETELQSRDKRLLRLKQIYATKVHEFLETVYTVLGYKIEITSPTSTVPDSSSSSSSSTGSSTGIGSGSVKLVSMYTRPGNLDPTFHVKNLLGTQITIEVIGGCQESRDWVTGAMKRYMGDMRSIPMLMAAVTVEWASRSHR